MIHNENPSPDTIRNIKSLISDIWGNLPTIHVVNLDYGDQDSTSSEIENKDDEKQIKKKNIYFEDCGGGSAGSKGTFAQLPSKTGVIWLLLRNLSFTIFK